MRSIMILIISSLAFIIVYLSISHIITLKRVNENQKAWNEYSKDMSDNEKMDCFYDWLSARKVEKGWKHYYIPKM